MNALGYMSKRAVTMNLETSDLGLGNQRRWECEYHACWIEVIGLDMEFIREDVSVYTFTVT